MEWIARYETNRRLHPQNAVQISALKAFHALLLRITITIYIAFDNRLTPMITCCLPVYMAAASSLQNSLRRLVSNMRRLPFRTRKTVQATMCSSKPSSDCLQITLCGCGRLILRTKRHIDCGCGAKLASPDSLCAARSAQEFPLLDPLQHFGGILPIWPGIYSLRFVLGRF